VVRRTPNKKKERTGKKKKKVGEKTEGTKHLEKQQTKKMTGLLKEEGRNKSGGDTHKTREKPGFRNFICEDFNRKERGMGDRRTIRENWELSSSLGGWGGRSKTYKGCHRGHEQPSCGGMSE